MQQKITINETLQRVWRWHSKYRYYSVYLQKNLFGEWIITQSWGGLKNRLGGMKTMTFTTINEALNFVCLLEKKRIKRNYFNYINHIVEHN